MEGKHAPTRTSDISPSQIKYIRKNRRDTYTFNPYIFAMGKSNEIDQQLKNYIRSKTTQGSERNYVEHRKFSIN